jgi:hypothetical protein
MSAFQTQGYWKAFEKEIREENRIKGKIGGLINILKQNRMEERGETHERKLCVTLLVTMAAPFILSH